MEGKLPPITIVMTTWMTEDRIGRERLKTAMQVAMSWVRHLEYLGSLRLHISDDGSERSGDIQMIVDASAPMEYTVTMQKRQGVGASLNRGMRKAFKTSPLFAYFVDDWALDYGIDLTPWANILMNYEEIGMVRLGPPHPGLTGEVKMYPGGWLLDIDKHHFAYGMRPALYHKRFIDAYGWFDEGLTSLECERRYNRKVCSTPGPAIVYALPYPWRHIGGENGEELSTIVPGEEINVPAEVA